MGAACCRASPTCVRIIEQACAGVDAIHATGTMHRDLKPSNLLIDKAFRVAVGDFGVARAPDPGGQPGPLVGTAAYMAPEAAFGEETFREQARDVYALGCIAYELLVGRPPFVGETEMNVLTQHVLQVPVPPSQRRPGLPSVYDDAILKALAKDADDRYLTAGDFRDALVAAHRGTADPTRILVVDDDPDWRQLLVSEAGRALPAIGRRSGRRRRHGARGVLRAARTRWSSSTSRCPRWTAPS